MFPCGASGQSYSNTVGLVKEIFGSLAGLIDLLITLFINLFDAFWGKGGGSVENPAESAGRDGAERRDGQSAEVEQLAAEPEDLGL